MFNKNVFVIFVVIVTINGLTYAKNSRKHKPPRNKEEDSSFQPDVVAYSTFGFNDVGKYDGFMPSSPDYTSFLNGGEQESTTRLYGPAFPTALDSDGFDNNYVSNMFDSQSQVSNDDFHQDAGVLRYSQNEVNFVSGPSSEDNHRNNFNNDFSSYNSDEMKPIYGTKLNSKTKIKQKQRFNNTAFNALSSSYVNPSENIYFGFDEVSTIYENKPTQNKTNVSYLNVEKYLTNYSLPDIQNNSKAININNPLSFPRVVDFTNFNQFDMSSVDLGSPSFSNPLNTDLNFPSNYETGQTFADSGNTYNKIKSNHFNYNTDEDEETTKPIQYIDHTVSHAHSISLPKFESGSRTGQGRKKKLKKPWTAANYTNYYKNAKNNSYNGYQYSTNNSNIIFKYDNEVPKKNSEVKDEIIPASSNMIDFNNYQIPEPDFTNIKPVFENEFASYQPFKEKVKPPEDNYNFQNLFQPSPSTTSSYWGNVFKHPEDYSIRNQPKAPQFSKDVEDDFITIPKAPPYNKLTGHKFTDWPHESQSPYKSNKELFSRFKSEEDLLGLRNHDTSHPSYLPTFYPNLNNDESDDNDNENYKKLVSRWKESYLKAKYRDSAHRGYENDVSDTKAIHVPLPRPYPIEIPHPVIVPVPQPYPVQVPVSKPVAVPVVKEITLSIEKPVPYPVYKSVPYPIEKLVPVPVEKEVTVPVSRPYPIHIPHVRPVFHHTKSTHDDMESDFEENDYYSQRNKIQYRNRPYSSSHNRPRRPTRTVNERNRRRWPEGRKPAPYNLAQKRRRPSSLENSRNQNHEFQSEIEDDRHYYLYCKRTRKC